MDDDERDIDEGYNADVWQPSERKCFACGADTQERGWWDDAPSNGGACIGTLYQCTVCDWSDSV